MYKHARSAIVSTAWLIQFEAEAPGIKMLLRLENSSILQFLVGVAAQLQTRQTEYWFNLMAER